jgi:hypothetical protein
MSTERSSLLADLVKSLTTIGALYAGTAVRRAASAAAGYLVVGILLAVSLCFLTLAGYRALSLAMGSIEASLIVGCTYLFAALVVALVLQMRRR